jgi:iron-sulfur cluster repair protein YtfE (RIC family)
MKRHKSLIPLSHDHFHGLKAASMLKKDAPVFKNLPNDPEGKRKYILDFFESDLIDHFKKEEEILYPISRGKSKELDEIWVEIFNEHKKIFELVDLIRNSSNINNDLNSLGEALEDHIRKEERILFPLIEKNCSEIELQKIV